MFIVSVWWVRQRDEMEGGGERGAQIARKEQELKEAQAEIKHLSEMRETMQVGTC